MPLPDDATFFDEIATDYFSNMNIVVGVTIGGVSPSTGRVLAFVGTQMRGTSQPGLRIPFGPAAGVYSFEMTVYGDVEGEVLNFFHQGADGQLTALDRTIPYKAREVVGNALSPFLLIGVGDAFPPPPPQSPPP
jgi:hypothetical protein